MHQYRAPTRDMKFLMYEVFDYDSHFKSIPQGANADKETVCAIIDECAKFCENTLAPLNQSGDQEGCHWKDGVVTTPKGFKEAYQEYISAGWQGLSLPEAYGGQNLPTSLSLIKAELMGTANWSFAMYPGLSLGCMNTIMLHGTEEQKQIYLTKLSEGTWSGTMCLTEPQCGSDLAQVKTKAIPQPDGTYHLSGTKIFISAGEHDLTENIVHIVLARLPDAPPGTKGISLFIVPKFIPNQDGTIGARNSVNCGSIEHKMGIKASATCVMNFDNAVGYLIGPVNKGLECMFTFMNTARLGTAIQGISHAELSFQGALAYAKERRSMRALSGKKEPDQVADSLIYHGDVRRMLLIQKAIAEGGRAMMFSAAKMGDQMVKDLHDKRNYEYWDSKLGFLTPILKGFLTELGFEAANHGVQVFGGHGFIQEWGMEQIVRDARISTLYEGTTGIQALDLLGRKIMLHSKGKAVDEYVNEIMPEVQGLLLNKKLGHLARRLYRYLWQWRALVKAIGFKALKNKEVIGCVACDFLYYSGYVILAYTWLKMAKVAQDKLDNGNGEHPQNFYQAKIDTAEFVFEYLLPRANGHFRIALSSGKSAMNLAKENFIVE